MIKLYLTIYRQLDDMPEHATQFVFKGKQEVAYPN